MRLLSKLIIVLLSGCFSCTEIIELVPQNGEPRLVVNSFYRPDSLWTFQVHGLAAPLASDAEEVVEGVSIEVLENGQPLALSFRQDSSMYSSDYYPKLDTQYEIRVSAPGYPTARATTMLHAPNLPISASVLASSPVLYTTATGQVPVIPFELALDDPDAEGDAYIVQVYGEGEVAVNGDTLTDVTWKAGIQAQIDTEYIKRNLGGSPGYFLDDIGFNGERFAANFGIREFVWQQNGSSLWLITWHLSDEMKRWFKTLEDHHQAEGNPYTQPVQVYSNVTNGVGIVAGFREYRILLRP